MTSLCYSLCHPKKPCLNKNWIICHLKESDAVDKDHFNQGITVTTCKVILLQDIAQRVIIATNL